MSPKEERKDDAARPGEGKTVSGQGETQSPRPRAPHERDESADHQAAETESARRMGAIAHDDVMEGQVDTSKAEEMDATYHRVRQDAEPTSTDKPERKR